LLLAGKAGCELKPERGRTQTEQSESAGRHENRQGEAISRGWAPSSDAAQTCPLQVKEDWQ
jgi:hypothetical protein